jgi:hypothetical protein
MARARPELGHGRDAYARVAVLERDQERVLAGLAAYGAERVDGLNPASHFEVDQNAGPVDEPVMPVEERNEAPHIAALAQPLDLRASP